MLTLICGGSGSGKSEFAERYSLQKGEGLKKYYIATMMSADRESLERIERHRSRRGDGFVTIERGRDIGEISAETEEGSLCLLECMGNLVANEMFGPRVLTADEVRDKVMGDIERLTLKAGHLIVVTNDVFRDAGFDHDAGTLEYLRALGMINEALAKISDEVVEAVFGNIIYHKGDKINLMLDKADDKTEDMDGSLQETEGFILVTGGACQGKLEFVRSYFDARKYRVYDGVLPLTDGASSQQDEDGMIIDHLDRYAWEHMEDGTDLLQNIMEAAKGRLNCVIIGDETGCGIVPADEKQRRFRDVYGRLMTDLSRKASQTWRVFCGLGTRIG